MDTGFWLFFLGKMDKENRCFLSLKSWSALSTHRWLDLTVEKSQPSFPTSAT